jgi:hypothetical protein
VRTRTFELSDALGNGELRRDRRDQMEVIVDAAHRLHQNSELLRFAVHGPMDQRSRSASTNGSRRQVVHTM